ncbi:disulfide bond formation protein B [Candidatus Poriferisodalis sp.]|uniref:disulfide bond formation protein B n=1 Tax=Candidatus Poriferisodalis sp. TaxID=3101277 RepID=UPI003B027F8C
MSLEQMLRLFAVAALACNAATVVVLFRRARGRQLSARTVTGIAAALAVGATLGSLYLSEIAHLEPCRWCWFQRIAMYPLALVLVIGQLVRDRGVYRYGLPMCVVGAAMSTWHYLLQHFPGLEGATTCSLTSPCTVRYAWEFGFVSIPYMAGSAFILVGVLLNLSRRRS